MKKLKLELKNMKFSPFENTDALIRLFDRLRNISEEMISDILDWRENHANLHKKEDGKIVDLEKTIKRLEKRVKNLELKKDKK